MRKAGFFCFVFLARPLFFIQFITRCIQPPLCYRPRLGTEASAAVCFGSAHTAWVHLVLMSVTVDAVPGKEKLMLLPAWMLFSVLICPGWLCLPCLAGLGHSSQSLGQIIFLLA